MTKIHRRALIKLLAETSGYEEGSLSRSPTHAELAEARERISRVGGEWMARHRGLLGSDGYAIPGRAGRRDSLLRAIFRR